MRRNSMGTSLKPAPGISVPREETCQDPSKYLDNDRAYRQLSCHHERLNSVGGCPPWTGCRFRGTRMMRRTLKALFSVALAAATFGLPAPGAAGADSPVTVQVEGGYGGVVPQGGWAPIQVDVTNHGPDTKATLKLSVATGQNGQTGGGAIKGPVVLPSTGSVATGGWYGFSGPGSAPGPAVTRELDVVLPAGTMKHFTAYLPSSPGTWTAEVVGPSGKLLAAARTQVTRSTSLSVAV